MTNRSRARRLTRFAGLGAVVLAPGALAARAGGAATSSHVVRDGSLGAAGAVQPVNGSYAITASLGKQVGPNLFQSFSQLNLASGETATFSGPAAVHNVLARVTGGAASSIDGTLQCTIPGAAFYLVNPSGVVFGPDAQLDIKGSFAVTTARLVHGCYALLGLTLLNRREKTP